MTRFKKHVIKAYMKNVIDSFMDLESILFGLITSTCSLDQLHIPLLYFTSIKVSKNIPTLCTKWTCHDTFSTSFAKGIFKFKK